MKFFTLATANMTLVIEVLPASGHIVTNRLNAAIFGGVDCHVGPRGRNSQLPDAGQILLRDLATVSVLITKATLRRSHSQNAVRMNPLGSGHKSRSQKSEVSRQKSDVSAGASGNNEIPGSFVGL